MDNLSWPDGPFSRAEALANGVTSRMLQHPRYTRVHPRVWRLTSHVMTDQDRVSAARLAMPEEAHLTGISRLQQLGLDYGPRSPVRFVVETDLHLDIEGIFLHRTKALPPLDDVGVCVEAAFMSYCSLCRVIDAIKVGDWLLHHEFLDRDRLLALATAEPWRAGAQEVMWIEPYLESRSRSLKESEVRSVLEFAGLRRPESNLELGLEEHVKVVADLIYKKERTLIEYEGTQHQTDREQYGVDLDRYALLRRHHYDYVQVTEETLASPRRVALEVQETLVANGYDGPKVHFGDRWRLLFGSLHSAVGPRDLPRSAA